MIPHSKERAASSSSRWPDCTKTTESRAEHDMADRALAESQLTSGRSASLVSGIHVRCCFLKALFASKLQCLRFEHEACTHCYVVLSSQATSCSSSSLFRVCPVRHVQFHFRIWTCIECAYLQKYFLCFFEVSGAWPRFFASYEKNQIPISRWTRGRISHP